MSTYSKTMLEALWASVNPGNGDPHTMAAIALAESSGNSSSVNSIGACGLWQIHPYEAGCLNPVTNAMQAGKKLRAQGLGAWETYTNGSYRSHLGGSSSPSSFHFLPLPGGGGLEEELFNFPKEGYEKGQETLEAPFKGLAGITHFLTKVSELLFTRSGWVRIGKVVIGVSVLLIGIFGLANVGVIEQTQKGTGKIKKTAETGAAVAALVK